MSKKIIFLLCFIFGCSSIVPPHKPHVPKEYSKEEVINATQLLTKIYDVEMSPLSCVPDADEASLLLRTIRPRMEVIQDDLEAMLDDPAEVDKLIKTCDQGCICLYLDDLLREHQVVLTKEQQKTIKEKKLAKEINRCLTFAQNTFCKSELFQELDKEKADFSFEE